MSSILDSAALKEIFVRSLSELGAGLAVFLPKLVAAAVILLVGWLMARGVQAIAAGLLSRAGLDRASERLGLQGPLREAGISRPPSDIIARLLFWLLMLTFILSSVETMGLSAVTATIDRLIAWVPNVIAAGLILLLGLVGARFLRNLVSSSAAAAQIPYARQLGAVVHGGGVVTVLVVAIGQLGVDTSLLRWFVLILAAAFAGGLGLSFALASREVMGGILAGYYLRKSLREGGSVRLSDREGVLDRVGPVDTLFRSGESSWSIPNRMLLEHIIDRAPEA